MNDKLIEELKEWKDKYLPTIQWEPSTGDKEFDEILSRHSQEVEPLAVLADRKGWWISRIDGNGEKGHQWQIGLMVSSDESDEWKGFEATTYTAAEDKARQYLEGLSDVKGEGIDRAEGKK